MRVLITHDETGNILSLAVPAQDVGDQLAIEPHPKETVSEVDIAAPDQERPFDDLNRIVHEFRVAHRDGQAKLVEKRKS
jgi:hypothetical protein